MGVLPGVLRSRVRAGQHRRAAVHPAQALSRPAALARALRAALAALATALSAALGGAAHASVPPALAELEPGARLAGQGRLTWLGLKVYDARLWTGPGFSLRRFDAHAFALELEYLRPLRAADIAERSIEEMRRAGPLADADARRWREALSRLLPDVAPGDRLTGVHRPGRGARFFHNGRPLGEIAEPAFAARFFGIWLAPWSSEPRLRDTLAGAQP